MNESDAYGIEDTWQRMMELADMAVDRLDDAPAVHFINAVVAELQAKVAGIMGTNGRNEPLDHLAVINLPQGSVVDILWPADEERHRYKIVRVRVPDQVYATTEMDGLKGTLDPHKLLSAHWPNPPKVWLVSRPDQPPASTQREVRF